MYENAVPVFEMKNKLSFYLHKAEAEGPVFISGHGKPKYVLMTIEDLETLQKSAPQEKSTFEIAAELRQKYGVENNDFDLNDFIEAKKSIPKEA